jgi:hypothetical protein
VGIKTEGCEKGTRKVSCVCPACGQKHYRKLLEHERFKIVTNEDKCANRQCASNRAGLCLGNFKTCRKRAVK